MLTEIHKGRYDLVKHQACQHVLRKGRADITTVGRENSQATAQLMTVTTLEKCFKGQLQRWQPAHWGKGKSQERRGEVEMLSGSGCVLCCLLHMLNQDFNQKAKVPGIMGKHLKKWGSKSSSDIKIFALIDSLMALEYDNFRHNPQRFF